jgi:hypothetical protein
MEIIAADGIPYTHTCTHKRRGLVNHSPHTKFTHTANRERMKGLATHRS